MGAGAGSAVPVGCDDVRGGCWGRAPGGGAVGAKARLRVGRLDVSLRGTAWTPCCSAVDAAARPALPVGYGDYLSGRRIVRIF